MRIDKFLWCIRLFKTRTLATDACKAGKIRINNTPVKASLELKGNETFTVRQSSILYTYRIIELPKSRCAAKDVTNFREDLTNPEELEKLKMIRMNQGVFRDGNSGRPTKKDRRDMIRFFND